MSDLGIDVDHDDTASAEAVRVLTAAAVNGDEAAKALLSMLVDADGHRRTPDGRTAAAHAEMLDALSRGSFTEIIEHGDVVELRIVLPRSLKERRPDRLSIEPTLSAHMDKWLAKLLSTVYD